MSHTHGRLILLFAGPAVPLFTLSGSFYLRDFPSATSRYRHSVDIFLSLSLPLSNTDIPRTMSTKTFLSVKTFPSLRRNKQHCELYLGRKTTMYSPPAVNDGRLPEWSNFCASEFRRLICESTFNMRTRTMFTLWRSHKPRRSGCTDIYTVFTAPP